MGRDALQKLWISLLGLGTRRLTVLVVVAAATIASIAVATLYLGRPQREVLYSGLSRDDVSRIGLALQSEGIDFDVSADGTTVDVNYGEGPRARMDLAQKGLPENSDTGYEIFNNVGSFGLTSFMQDVTETRALEGELTRSIETMNGIRSARVHLVLPDRGSFRDDQQTASASVVINTALPADAAPSQAIRLLVSAAVPSLKVGNVNVLSTDGTVLASSETDTASAGGMASVEQTIDRDIEAKIRRTLTPYLGVDNFQVSVVSRVNLDRTTTNETTYDPASRVERSVRTIRENDLAQNSSADDTAASVSQQIPTSDGTTTDSGKNSNQTNDRREDTTNYELSSKTVETNHDGYQIENLSVAVLVNQAQLDAAAAKGPNALPVEHQTMDIEQLVSAAAGLDKTRGDQLKVAAASFVDDNGPQAASDPGILGTLMAQFGTLFNGIAMVAVALIVVLLGLRPAMRSILSRGPETLTAIAGPDGGDAGVGEGVTVAPGVT